MNSWEIWIRKVVASRIEKFSKSQKINQQAESRKSKFIKVNWFNSNRLNWCKEKIQSSYWWKFSYGGISESSDIR